MLDDGNSIKELLDMASDSAALANLIEKLRKVVSPYMSRWQVKNMKEILQQAFPREINQGSNSESVDDDWAANFFGKAQNVSDSQMQTLWAKILAGEVDSPGTFSKRTVNLISELEQREADLFTKLCGFGWIIGEDFRPLVFDETAKIYNQHAINLNSLSDLDSIGLIQFNPTSNYYYPDHDLGRKDHVFYYDKPLYLEISKDHDMSFGKVLLTRIGQELAPICGSKPVDGFYEYARQKWGHHLPWTANFFDKPDILSEISKLNPWNEQIQDDKWTASCFVFSRGGYHYYQPRLGQPTSLAEAKEKFLARTAKVPSPDSADVITRILFDDIAITIPNYIPCNEHEFNSQNEWSNTKSLHINLRVSQALGLYVLLYPEVWRVESTSEKWQNYLRSLC